MSSSDRHDHPPADSGPQRSEGQRDAAEPQERGAEAGRPQRHDALGHAVHGGSAAPGAAADSHGAHASQERTARGGERAHREHDHHAGTSPGAVDHAAMGHVPAGAAAGREHAGHGAAHADHTGHEQMFRQRFWVSLLLSIPVLLYSPMVQQLLGFRMPAFPGSQWIEPVLSVVIFLYGGVPFLQLAAPEIQNRRPGMMTLISLAISVAFVYSLVVLFSPLGVPNQMGFFWELVTLIDIMLLGHWIEMRSVRQASGALNELTKLMPDTAERIGLDGATEHVPVSRLRTGDLVLVRPGASVPADGEVVEGSSDVSEAMITGESKPVSKKAGAKVIAGTLNGDGSLRVRVTATGNETALAGIMRLVEQAQQSKSKTQVLADQAAGWLFWVALAIAAITAVAWTLAIGFDVQVIERVATVLVIACPHALGLAIPLVVAITTALGARNGILVRDRLALEAARDIGTIIFDKTGTLTRGEFGVVSLATVEGWDENRALALTAAVEGDSEHTIARGIRASAAERGLPLPAVNGFEALKGRGVRGEANGQTVHAGGPRLLESRRLGLPKTLAAFERAASGKGQSVVHLVVDDRVVASFALADVIRPESREAVRRLHAMGVEVAMLTGDSQAVAKTVADELGIDTYFAEVLPEHKDQKVMELQRQGKRVAMVGDGVNDAPALTRADVGIAIGSGTDVAVESAGIILVRSDPLDVVNIFTLSRASYRKMIQNLLWATGYNVVALPLAAGVLAPWGIVLSPAIGAVLMSASTIVVALNAQLLRRLTLNA
ncbi:MAG: copper-translocating P-type ATPase [Anaerolineales bacterium]|nr:copper-translocating P-type ATPase [Anaerolineales bacterium]